MKKSLLALAVMGAFAGAAQAQVTVYGLIDTGIIVTDNGADRLTELGSGVGGATRWGIRGSEDLGNGLKGHFVLESGFSGDSGAGAGGFSRLSYVGLEGGFGTLRFGRQDTAMKDATTKIDPFGSAGLANSHDFLLYNGSDIDQRRPNQVTYLLPKMGGLNGGVYYNFGEVRGDSGANQSVAVRLGYDNGPISVQAAYDDTTITTTAAGVVTADYDRTDMFLGATYDFGVAKLHAAFADREVAGADVNGGPDTRSAMVGVSANLGGGKVMANYIRTETGDNIDNADSNVIALGYNYSLSKRTAIVARYVRTANDDGADRGILGGDIDAAALGDTVTGFGIGIQHRF